MIADFGEAMDPRAPKRLGDSAALPMVAANRGSPGKALSIVAKLSSSC